MDVESRSPSADRYHDVIRFDRWAPRYDRSLLQGLLFAPTHAAAIDAALHAGADPQVVLDLGCGTGRLLGRAATAWPRAAFVGVDAASEMVNQARRSHAGDGRFRFEVADAAALPLQDAFADLVFSTISFHHWADQRGGLREAARVMRPQALFVLADIRPPLVLQPVMRGFHASRARRRLFESCGFRIVAERRPLRLGGNVLITVARKA